MSGTEWTIERHQFDADHGYELDCQFCSDECQPAEPTERFLHLIEERESCDFEYYS